MQLKDVSEFIYRQWQEPEKRYPLLAAMMAGAVITSSTSLALIPAVVAVIGTSMATYAMVKIARACIEMFTIFKSTALHVDQTVQNLNQRIVQAEETLKGLNQGILEANATLKELKDQIEPLSDKANTMLDKVNDQITPLSKKATTTLDKVNHVLDSTKKTFDDVNKEVKALSGQVKKTIATVDAEVKDLSGQMKETIATVNEEVEGLSEQVKETIATVNEEVKGLSGEAKKTIDTTNTLITNVNTTTVPELTQKLNALLDATKDTVVVSKDTVAKLRPDLEATLEEARVAAQNTTSAMNTISVYATPVTATARGIQTVRGYLPRFLGGTSPAQPVQQQQVQLQQQQHVDPEQQLLLQIEDGEGREQQAEPAVVRPVGGQRV